MGAASATYSVTRLTLTDFRNYAHLRLEPLRPLVALVGANGAGKRFLRGLYAHAKQVEAGHHCNKNRVTYARPTEIQEGHYVYDKHALDDDLTNERGQKGYENHPVNAPLEPIGEAA